MIFSRNESSLSTFWILDGGEVLLATLAKIILWIRFPPVRSYHSNVKKHTLEKRRLLTFLPPPFAISLSLSFPGLRSECTVQSRSCCVRLNKFLRKWTLFTTTIIHKSGEKSEKVFKVPRWIPNSIIPVRVLPNHEAEHFKIKRKKDILDGHWGCDGKSGMYIGLGGYHQWKLLGYLRGWKSHLACFILDVIGC